jgi:ribosomal protein L37AE/L43A
MTAKRDVEAGQPVTTADVEPVECEHDRAINEYLSTQRAQAAPDVDPDTAERCPSLHCDRPIKRLESGVYFCPSCSWHGRELTPPVVPRFAVGDWVRAKPSATLAQVVAIRSTPRAVDAWQYSLTNADESGVVERNEPALVAAERPR